MILYKDLINFVVLPTDSIVLALQKIERNKHKIVYVVDERNHLLGTLADGDYRRWCLHQSQIDMTTPIKGIYNANCFSMSYEASRAKLEHKLQATGRSIPLVDDNQHLMAIVEKGAKFFNVDGVRISRETPAFIIAEIGNNHQGDITLAKRLVDLAIDAGVDCVKFQMRSMKALYGDDIDSGEIASQDLGSQYTLDLLNRFQLSNIELIEVFDYCKQRNIIVLCTPWDLDSLTELEQYGLSAYKVASADFTNYQLLEAMAETGKLMICSTGMSTEDEIRATVEFLENKKAQYILLHCNSTYPAPFKDINLNYMQQLEELSQGVVGYSGHERGISVPVAAVSLGAKVIEKHFTVDKSLEGNDHKVSLLPDEMKAMVEQIRQVEESLGHAKPRKLTQGELLNREVLAKSLYVMVDLEQGTVIERDMIGIRSPGKGLQPNRVDELVGKTTLRTMSVGDIFCETDLTGSIDKRQRYRFDRPYGIPVRYHDYCKLTQDIDLDFVEFHLSYADMELDVCEYIEYDENMGFSVHAPELFKNDHLLDLASFDSAYLQRSVAEIQRVIEQTLMLKAYFPKTEVPIIVINAGGWNETGFLNKDLVAQKYQILANVLDTLDTAGVELAIQTMPPYPWHFGGQSYHNLFVKAEEIRDFCKRTDVKVCLDVSHSMMACNFLNASIYEFVETVAPYVVHMHIVDAKGIDGEGIQMGEGDIDFRRLGTILHEHIAGVPFVPEVWQGHNNGGQGFWKALDYLEGKFSSN